MKRFLSSLLILSLLWTVAPQGTASAVVSAPGDSNYVPEISLVDNGGILRDVSAAARNSQSGEFVWSGEAGTSLYFGWSEKFDGIALDLDLGAANGSTVLEYWNGSSWITLKNTASLDLLGTVEMEWDERPSSWAKRNFGVTQIAGDPVVNTQEAYFVRLRSTQSFERGLAIKQAGLKIYNLRFDVGNELGSDLNTYSVSFTGGDDNKIYDSKKLANGQTLYALNAGSGDTYNFTVQSEGYRSETGSIFVSSAENNMSKSLLFSHKIQGIEQGTSNRVNITSENSDYCQLNSGFMYCAVPVAIDQDIEITVSATGYENKTVRLSNRSNASDNQAYQVVSFTKNSNGGGSTPPNTTNLPDLEVRDIFMERDGDVVVEIRNNSQYDVSRTIYVYAYVDGDREWTGEISELDDYEEVFLTMGELLDDRYEHDVEVCVDPTNRIEERNENNNCLEVELDYDDYNDRDDYCDDDYRYDDRYRNYYDDYCYGNRDDFVYNGSHPFYDVDNHWSEDYVAFLYNRDIVDGKSRNRYDPNGETTRAEMLKLVMETVDYGERDLNWDYYQDVNDSDWFVDYVNYATYLGFVDGHYVNGRRYFSPNEAITRAEAAQFIYNILERVDDDYDFNDHYYSRYSDRSPFYDVESWDWYYEAVVYAEDIGIFEGYEGRYFYPDQYLSRAEAAVVTVRLYEYLDDNNLL